jgi:hypothetical protein
MRYLILSVLLASQVTAASTYVVAPPRYELLPCGQISPTVTVALPDGTLLFVVRVEQPDPNLYQIVGLRERMFCGNFE